MLRVWWIPQLPCEPFYVPVENIEEAAKILKVLAEYDNFQLAHRMIPDNANMGGVESFIDGEWVEWTDLETGEYDVEAYLAWRTQNE